MHGKWNISDNIVSQIISKCGTVLMRQAIFTRRSNRTIKMWRKKKAMAKVQAWIDFDRGLSSKSSFSHSLVWMKFNLKWMLNRTGNIDSDFVSLSIVCAPTRSFAIPHFQFEFLTFCRFFFFFGKLIAHTHIQNHVFRWLLSIFPPFLNRFHISMVHTFPLRRRQNNHYAKAKAIDISSSFLPQNVYWARARARSLSNTRTESK